MDEDLIDNYDLYALTKELTEIKEVLKDIKNTMELTLKLEHSHYFENEKEKEN